MIQETLKKIVIFVLFTFSGTLLPGTAESRVIVNLKNNHQEFSLFGAQIYDGLGDLIIVEDINGDGLNDIIVAATASDGPDDTEINRGAVYVVFGKEGGNFPPGAAESITTAADLTIYGVEHGINGMEGDEIGYGLAAADLNGDGINDLIISGIYADGIDNARPDSGQIYVIYGRSVFPPVMDLSVDTDILINGADGGIAEGSPNPDDPDKGDMAGYSLATGDFNNDGKQDLAIGAVLGDGPDNTRIHSGETYILWGQETFPSVIDLATYTNLTTIWGAEVGDFSGFVVFANDVNNDGIDDLMIGALLADGPSNSRDSSGETYIFYGKPSFPSSIDLATTDPDVTIYGAEAGDQNFNPVNHIGSADVNGDGLADIIIGAPFADSELNEQIDSGETYIILGGSAFPQTIDLLTDADTIIYGINAGDHSGFVLAFGDLNGDGMDDILISAPNSDGHFDVNTSSGEGYVIYGRKIFPPTLDLSDSDVLIYGPEAYDFFGITTYVADVNNDGIDDILAGIAASDGENNLIEDAGELVVILGGIGGVGIDAITPTDLEVSSCQPVFEWTPGLATKTTCGPAGNETCNIWIFQLYEAPDTSLMIYSSPVLLYPNHELPDNFLSEIPADKTLYWKVFGADASISPPKVIESQVFSFTRVGLHLLSPEDSSGLVVPPILEWSYGCSQNTTWIAGISDDPDFTTFIALSPYLDQPFWVVSDSIWQTLPTGIPLYWKSLGFYQPVLWRVQLDWAQEAFSFTKTE